MALVYGDGSCNGFMFYKVSLISLRANDNGTSLLGTQLFIGIFTAPQLSSEIH